VAPSPPVASPPNPPASAAGTAASGQQAKGAASSSLAGLLAAVEPWGGPSQEDDRGTLSARLALAAGLTKGIKNIAELAKPMIKAGGKKHASPLDACLTGSARTREESKRAMAESEQNLVKMYARDHDGLVTARALLVGCTKALTRMCAAAEALEVEASKARAQMLGDQDALAHAKSASISVLTAERDMMMQTLRTEISNIENDTNFSLTILLANLNRTEGKMAYEGEQASDAIRALERELQQARTLHVEYKAAAETKETRLSHEIARLCGQVDRLKEERRRADEEHAKMHAEVVKNMSAMLADKQRTIDEKEMDIRELEAKLDGTSATLTNQLRDLAREKELREQRLREENAQAAERSKRANAVWTQQMSTLKAEKEERERVLAQGAARAASRVARPRVRLPARPLVLLCPARPLACLAARSLAHRSRARARGAWAQRSTPIKRRPSGSLSRSHSRLRRCASCRSSRSAV
jgi:hypothetical protein